MDKVKRFTRIVTDAAGGSAFQDDEIPLETELTITGAPPLFGGTVAIASTGLLVPADTSGAAPPPAPHPAPQRQWVVILCGDVGHITRVLGEPPAELLFLPS